MGGHNYYPGVGTTTHGRAQLIRGGHNFPGVDIASTHGWPQLLPRGGHSFRFFRRRQSVNLKIVMLFFCSFVFFLPLLTNKNSFVESEQLPSSKETHFSRKKYISHQKTYSISFNSHLFFFKGNIIS